MLRTATFLASSFIALCSPTGAEPRRFTGAHDGVAYNYTAELLPNQKVSLRGTYLDTGDRFSFTVDRNGYVDGRIGLWPVSFAAGQAARDRIVESLTAIGPNVISTAISR